MELCRLHVCVSSVAVDVCSFLEPCQSGGTCTNDGLGGFTCICPTGLTGPVCLSAVGPCASNPCGNQGRCEEAEGNQYVCMCPRGYGGAQCEEEVEEEEEEEVAVEESEETSDDSSSEERSEPESEFGET